MYTDLYGLKTVIFRYFNVFGERSPTVGQYAPVIGVFQRQHAAGQPLTIVGTGEQRRDFVHVKDVAWANIVAAGTDLHDDHYGMVYNIGSGSNISILEIADMISESRVFIPARPGEVDTTLADLDRTMSVFYWEPEISVQRWMGHE
jgi:UDP-glucose 4-epimerase